ncbi:MAG TPA: AEC family transporter [bacterium]|nr:AEC family transporter [bacterium]
MPFFIRISGLLAAGLVLGRLKYSFRKRAVKILVDFSYYFLVPFLFFLVLVSQPFHFSRIAKPVFLSWAVISSGILLAVPFSKLFRMPFRETVLPLSFMNSAYLNFPFQSYLLGEGSLFHALLFNMGVTLFIYSVGVILLEKNKRLNFHRLPVIHALLLALVWRSVPLPLYGFMTALGKILQTYFVPLMLVLVGIQLSALSLSSLREGLAGSLCRMCGGFIFSFAILYFMPGEPLMKNSLLLSSSMPSAVHTYILAEKFQANSPFASSCILAGTVLSLAVFPLVFPCFS